MWAFPPPHKSCSWRGAGLRGAAALNQPATPRAQREPPEHRKRPVTERRRVLNGTVSVAEEGHCSEASARHCCSPPPPRPVFVLRSAGWAGLLLNHNPERTFLSCKPSLGKSPGLPASGPPELRFPQSPRGKKERGSERESEREAGREGGRGTSEQAKVESGREGERQAGRPQNLNKTHAQEEQARRPE